MSLHICLVTTVLLLAGAYGASNNEDVRGGYLFLLHDDNNLMLAAKEGNCYFVPISDLKLNSLYSPNLPETEEEVLKLLNGTTPADVTPINSTAIHSKFQDEFAELFCHGRTLHLVTVLRPTTPPPCVDAVSSVMTCSSLTDVCSTPNAAALCRKYCGLCQGDLLTCDFEENLCGWTNRRDDEFDWTRHSGPTSSANTGPPSDHTLGDARGHYLYIETSAPRQPGDRAFLQSPILSDSDSGYCLTFWYYMYGSGLGNLTVIMQAPAGGRMPVWSIDRLSVNNWQQAVVSLRPPSPSPFCLLFEGVRAYTSYGDIAIDDISVQYGPCQ